MSTFDIASDRILQLPQHADALEAYKSLAITAKVSLDGNAQAIGIAADGSTRLVTSEEGYSFDTSNSPGAVPSATHIDIALDSADALALLDGELSVLRAITTSRITAEGPIFGAIGLVHVLTHL